jgi:alpha-L-fucosidase
MKLALVIWTFASLNCFCQQQKGHDPVPTKSQLEWHDMDFYLFAHFGPNTFTDKEWGEGTERADVFNPTNLDCRQWCRIAKAAGAKGIIITAKHHDGFCLWPSKYSTHTVRESKWKNGKGDVLKELSKACKEYGLKFGVYISPWDRNHPKYGTAAYNDVFVNMMKEIFSNYGPIWELWWDGANGEGPNGKRQEYDWNRFKKTVKTISPNTVIFSDIGPHIRWVGNENGIAGETNWNLLDTAGFSPGAGAPPVDTLNRGNVNGKNWIPAECDVSIRPGWFYHKEEDEKVKSPEQLFQLYLKSVGRGANMLLNVPPDRTGMINERDSTALMEFKKLRDDNFKENFSLAAKKEFHHDGIIYQRNQFADGDAKTFQDPLDYTRSDFWLKFDPVKRVNCIVLEELIEKGQRIKEATLYLLRGADVVRQIHLSTVGHRRIITFPAEEVSAIRFVINDAKGPPLLSEIETYFVNENLIEK